MSADDAERPSALEPQVVHDGDRWRLWFLATTGEVGRGEQPDYELRYAESSDGVDWGAPAVFSDPTEGFFDNAVRRSSSGWDMVLARGTNLYGTRPFPPQGLWWTTTSTDLGSREGWSPPARLLDTDRDPEPWFAAGVCGPSFVRSTAADGAPVLLVFATGTRAPTSWWRAAAGRLRERRRPPPPAPYYLATGRLTFVAG